MNKKYLLLLALVGTNTFAAVSNEDLLQRIEKLEKKQTFMEKMKVGGDYRFSVDNLEYKLLNSKKASNPALLTNRIWLTFAYVQDKHLSFHAKLSYNSIYGQENFKNQPQFDSFDWFSSTTNTNNRVYLKEGYIDYKNIDLPYNIKADFGIGRRPTSYTKLLSLRDDEAATAPLGHIVSAEFDGGHIGFDLDKFTGISGLRIKFSAGRGLSSVDPSISATPNAKVGSNINMYAVNLVTYADKNIHTELQALQATNVVDIKNAGYDATGTFNPTQYDATLVPVGNINLASYMALYTFHNKAITRVFASFAISQTDPKSGQSMLGSTKKELGTSYWIGAQFQSLITKDGRWGIEFNHGSKYFRSFTYAEDTVIGSKIATRGNAYEVYFTEPITKGLSMQIRYTYLDYDYTGSNGFFGNQTGTPMKIEDLKNSPFVNSDMANSIVDTAQDIRFYLRYKF